ncbi:PEP-CTERM sorting domain-containing protein [Rhodopirellula sp.]|nr:PEP-CTERM sorting domain-containing protein [Rhodopirellula sp.]
MLKQAIGAIAVLLCLEASLAHAGVDYYSNSLYATSRGSLVSWKPLDPTDSAYGAVTMSPEESSGILQWQDASVSYKIFISDYFSNINVVESLSGTPTSTWSYSSGQQYRLDAATAIVKNPVESAEQELINGSAVAQNYNPSNNNYIGWSVENLNGSLYAIGWARINYNPQAPNNDTTDEFQIVEWGYNLATSGSSVVIGDSDTGGTVPEPQSLALMSLVGLGMLVRRRRTKS